MYKVEIFFLLILFSSCIHKDCPWQLESIATGNATSASSRLVSMDLPCSPLRLEFLATGPKITGFINLTKYHLSPSKERPDAVEIVTQIDGVQMSEFLPLLEGKMRLRLSDTLTTAIIESLQNGKKVDILLDGLNQTFEPNHFARLYGKINLL